MEKDQPARRDFIKLSALAMGGLAISPIIATAKGTPADKKLHIVCVGAHPGDPEFGCGGTMAKYSDAGHQVSFLYLTRGEASDAAKSPTEMAELRTREAEISCKILNATPRYLG